MISYALPLLVIAIGCYIGARFAMLANWLPVAGILRLIGLWSTAAWLGFGTPLYIALLCVPAGVLWWRLSEQLILQIALELVVGAAIVWHSETPPVPIYLTGLVIFDQLFVRVLLTKYDRQRESRKLLHRLIVVAGLAGCVLFVAHFYRHQILSYASALSPSQIINLVPEGAAPLWFYQRSLTAKTAGKAQPGSVYWQARYPESGDRCAISFHGAASPGSMQSSARTVGRGARRAGVRLFAVDHPGFGASPAPISDAPIDDWDPASLTTAVLNQMDLAACKNITVLGHSQGTTEALRLLTSNHPKVASVVVLGAGLYEKDQAQEDYWYSRFHIDRGIASANKVSRDNWTLIRDLYYLNQDYCKSRPAGRALIENSSPTNPPAPLHFVQFEREHANLVATRDELWRCLDYPGAERHLLTTDHYMDSLQIGSMVFVQPRSARLVANLLPGIMAESETAETDD